MSARLAGVAAAGAGAGDHVGRDDIGDGGDGGGTGGVTGAGEGRGGSDGGDVGVTGAGAGRGGSEGPGVAGGDGTGRGSGPEVPSAWAAGDGAEGDGGGVATAGAGGGADAAGAGPAATASPSAAITPTTVLMGTVAPGWTRISLNTPEAGAGISASTLSVEISKSGSSRCTLSPTFFIHFVMVPSAMDSPIWGMMTSVIRSPFQ
jgi:hypothetical protein